MTNHSTICTTILWNYGEEGIEHETSNARANAINQLSYKLIEIKVSFLERYIALRCQTGSAQNLYETTTKAHFLTNQANHITLLKLEVCFLLESMSHKQAFIQNCMTPHRVPCPTGYSWSCWPEALKQN